MSYLEKYTWEVYDSSGLDHQSKLARLRAYLKDTPENQIIFALNRLNRIEQLKALWEAGLNDTLQEAVLGRFKQLQGVVIP